MNSNVNKPEDGDSENNLCTDMLLKDSEINVLGSSKEEIFPNESTRVVICSYGLVSVLAESGRLRPGMFPCAIVDESHMLKNKSSKRTTCLLPILMATKRCVLLSGTPALARPAELWPQLCIVGTEQNGMWDDENNFLDRYVKRGDAQSRAELHAMLTGTVMIRRLKVDILKSMPRKRREKAALSILTEEQRHKFKELLADLRRGKGALGKLARQEHEETRNKPDDTVDESFKSVATLGNAVSDIAPEDARTNGRPLIRDLEGFQNAQAQLNEQLRRDFEQGQALIRQNLELQAYHLSDEERVRVVQDLNGQLRSKVEAAFNHGMQSIHSRFGHPAAGGQNADDELAETSKKRNVLSQLYEMTGNAKIPLIVDLLKRWLADPTKGKLCIFAHHISVLDAIANNACLSNKDGEDGHKYIRIDGSTNPKVRQQQIKTFQTDPSTRIALLGITAAGVAVTLTASSTVWFAELFWTPAIMIQAEDRVHRIGQTARVQCLYFVARGSLDDVLWRLIERKFRDLGEFVEGKEKLKLVVDHTYHRLKDLHDIFHDGKFDDDNNDDDVDDQEADDEDGLDLDLAQDIENDIQAFGEEENRMLHAADNDEELSDRASPATTQTISFTEDPPPNDVGTGRTEDDAIALSDDEDETASSLAVKPQAVDTEASSPAARSVPDGPQFRSYRIYLRGPKLGLEMAIYQGRLVVSRVLESRLRIHGEEGKPAVGDIVAAFNGRQLPMLQSMQPALKNIRDCLSAGPVEMIFSEDPAFSMFYRDYLAEERRRRMELRRIQLQQQRQRQRQPPTKPDEVIEID